MHILIDSTPLTGGHAGRGIGTYTRLLIESLRKLPNLTLTVQPYHQVQNQTFDLLHFPFFDFFVSSLPTPKVPTVVTIHDVIPLQFPDQYPIGLRGRLAKWRQQKKLSRVSTIVTDSNTSKQNIHSFLHLPLEKISTVYLAANPSLYPPSTSIVQKFMRSHQLSSPYVLYVGDINFNKNIPALIKSFLYLPENLHLVLLGKNFFSHDIPEWHAIERQIAASNIQSRVHMVTDIGSDNFEDLAAAYAGALCYVQPSLEEGFGLPVLEAQRCGVPVVASNCGSLLEIGGESTIFVEPTDEGLAGGIKKVLAFDNHQRDVTIKAGFEHEQKYSWDITAEKMLEIYTQAIRHTICQ